MADELNTDLEDEFDDSGAAAGDATSASSTSSTDPNAALTAALADLKTTVSGLKEPTKPVEKTLTDDERDELWGVFKPEKADPKFMQKFFRLTDDMTPEQVNEFKQLFGMFQQGLVKQSLTGAQNLMRIEMSKLQEELAPMREYVSAAKAEKMRSTFYSQFPALGVKNEDGTERYAKIVAHAATQLSTQEFKSEAEYFKALAESAAATIKGVLPEFDLGAVQKTTGRSPNAGTSPRLPRTSAGGTGGTAGGTQRALAVKGDATDEFLND